MIGNFCRIVLCLYFYFDTSLVYWFRLSLPPLYCSQFALYCNYIYFSVAHYPFFLLLPLLSFLLSCLLYYAITFKFWFNASIFGLHILFYLFHSEWNVYICILLHLPKLSSEWRYQTTLHSIHPHQYLHPHIFLGHSFHRHFLRHPLFWYH